MSAEFLSLIFYIAAFTISAYILSLGIRKKSGILIGFALIIPILISGFRYGVGTDYFNYTTIFGSHAKTSFDDFRNNEGFLEVGFFALEKISYYIAKDARPLFIMSAFITVWFFYKAIKKYNINYPGIAFFLFLLTIFPMTMNAVRQGVAMAIMFYAMSFILEKKPGKYFLYTFIAGIFHMSALLLLPFYFLGRYFDAEKKNKKTLAKEVYIFRITLILGILMVVVANALNLVLSIPGFERYSLYLNVTEEANNYIFYVKLMIVVTVLLAGRYLIFNGDYRKNAFFFSGSMVEVVILLLGFVSPFIKREAMYFSPFLVMLLPNIIDLFGRTITKRILGMAIVSLYGFGFFVISYYFLQQAAIIPYEVSIKAVINE